MLVNINKDREIINEFSADKEIYSTKIVDTLPDDINEFQYSYLNGKLVRGERVDKKKFKFAELEEYITKLKEKGVQYQDKWFKCDEEAKTNITQSILFIDSLIPLTWFTRNGEQGVVVFNTKEEFMAFVQVIASKMAEIQNKYYAYKYAIEQATTKEELDSIVFEEAENET